MPIFLLTNELIFPPVHLATPDGLLAVGGDLSVQRLLLAYRSGIFPWFCENEPVLWWSPDPRFVLFPEQLKVSKSMSRLIRKGTFKATFNHDFLEVIRNCRFKERKNQDGTWITSEMVESYVALHRAGHAHSVEVWWDGALAGGLYGVSVGRCFCGESMFTHISNASKYALIALVRRLAACGYTLIDCQVQTNHLKSLGAQLIPRKVYMDLLLKALSQPPLKDAFAAGPEPILGFEREANHEPDPVGNHDDNEEDDDLE